MARGIDVYTAYQKVHDWRAVRNAGYEFAYIKLTDGTGTRSEGGYTAGAQAAGIAAGGYHYAQFGDAVHQANVLLDRCEYFRTTDLAPCLDLEAPFRANQTAINFAVTFLKHVRARGHRPCLYANNSMMSALRGPVLAAVPDCWLWVARYASTNATAPTLRPGGLWHLHQYSQAGRVPGITASSVDLNDGAIPFNYRGGTTAAAAPAKPPKLREDDEAVKIDFKENTGTEGSDIQKASATFECFKGSALWNRAWVVFGSGWGTSHFKCYVQTAGGSGGVFEVTATDSDTEIVGLAQGTTGLNIQYTGDAGSLPSATVFGDLLG